MNIANYQIDVKLDTKRKIIEGTEILTWLNNTSDKIEELRFHLYHNAYKTSKSTFYKEDNITLGKYDTAYTNIQFIKILDGAVETPQYSFIQPDDNNPFDETVLSVRLPSPLKPRQAIRLNIGFITKIPPGGVGRSGYALGREFFFLSQWFPKIGVYEEKKGWNCHQFHKWTEFFADFGKYEAKITVPKNFFIAATGRRIDEKNNVNKTVTYTYIEENIHDFAFAASPYFIEIHDTFNEPQLKPVSIILMMQPEHKDQIEVHLQTIKKCLKYFGDLFGSYPYPVLTIIDPPITSSSMAMSYPTFITIGTNYLPMQNELYPENVIVYQFLHQYWSGIVANNEFEESWIDEGISTYYTAKFLQDTYNEPAKYFRIGGGVPMRAFPVITYDEFPVVAYMGEVKIPPFMKVKQGYLSVPQIDPIYKKAWLYHDKISYMVGSYYKPAIMLKTLEGFIGAEKMKQIMTEFFNSSRYRHPNTFDFINTTEKVTNTKLDWFFSQVLFGTEILDYGITDITNTNMDSVYKVELIIMRNGGIKFPVEIKITLENGDTLKDSWDGNDKWVRKSYFVKSPALGAQIDPEGKLLLDVNFANNSRLAHFDLSPFLRWVNQWLFWMQSFLQAILSIC